MRYCSQRHFALICTVRIEYIFDIGPVFVWLRVGTATTSWAVGMAMAHGSCLVTLYKHFYACYHADTLLSCQNASAPGLLLHRSNATDVAEYAGNLAPEQIEALYSCILHSLNSNVIESCRF
jgi:hypothetical protein